MLDTTCRYHEGDGVQRPIMRKGQRLDQSMKCCTSRTASCPDLSTRPWTAAERACLLLTPKCARSVHRAAGHTSSTGPQEALQLHALELSTVLAHALG